MKISVVVGLIPLPLPPPMDQLPIDAVDEKQPRRRGAFSDGRNKLLDLTLRKRLLKPAA